MKSWTAATMGIVFAATAACGSTASSHSSITDTSISADEMAVYETVLASWLDKKEGHQLVGEQLSTPPSKDDADIKECMKGLNFPMAQNVEGKKSLAGIRFKRAGIELVDSSQWKAADPQEGMANGKTLEAALREAFSKSLISFSQITFSSDGKDALVKFGMTCGSLCGSGSTIHLRKSDTGWAVVNRCSQWES